MRTVGVMLSVDDPVIYTAAGAVVATAIFAAANINAGVNELKLSVKEMGIKTDASFKEMGIKTDASLKEMGIKTESSLKEMGIKTELSMKALRDDMKEMGTKMDSSIEALRVEMKESRKDIKEELKAMKTETKAELKGVQGSVQLLFVTVGLLVTAMVGPKVGLLEAAKTLLSKIK